jgi:acyl-CoA thioester hydrolase
MAWSLRVPYGDCDQQGVVFNAKYLAYVDDCVDVWFADELGDDYQGAFDIMLKKATVEWTSPARYRDRLALTPSIARWGTTSFDVRVDGAVGERPVFTATIVYVSVSPADHTPVPVPDAVRARLA